MPNVRRSARLKEKEKRKQDEVVDSSDSDSAHSLSFMNVVSESWECPPSGKHLIPDATMVFSRRASLRSTKRLNEEALSVSTCSQPQKSKQHSAVNDLSQQLDDLVDNMITSEYQASAGYLQSPQAANPSSLTPATMHEAASVSINVNGLEGECVPLEQEPLAEDIQASKCIEKRVNKGHSKSTSTVARPCPCPSFSLNLTEMVQMWDDEDDEVDSIGGSLSMNVVDGYQVKPEQMPILRKIINRHGDIANNCPFTRMKYRSHLLEMTCDIIVELQEKNLREIKEDDLQEMIYAVHLLEIDKLDIGWLHERLLEILEVRHLLKESGKLKEKRESIRQNIEIVERELKECEAEKLAIEAKYQYILDREIVCKKNLARARDESAMVNADISDAKSKVRRFRNCSLVDGLL